MATFRDRLQDESGEWVNDGVISPDQRREILSRYEGESSRAVRVILTIGALMVGIGAVIFVGTNWAQIPDYGRVGLLLVATLGAFAAGGVLTYRRQGHERLGSALVFLGALLTGATLFLSVGIYEIELSTHWLLLVWTGIVTPAAYATRSRPTLLVGILTFAWWTGAFLGGGNAIEVLIGFAKSIGGYAFYGLMLYGIGRLHEGTRFGVFSGLYCMVGIVFAYLMLFSVILTELGVLAGILSSAFLPVFIGASVLVGAVVMLRTWRTDNDRIEIAWYGTAFGLACAMLGVAWMYGDAVESLSLGLSAFLVLYHIVFFALVLVTIYAGYTKRAMAYINIGLVFFVLHIGYLYVTTIVDYLPKSIAFVIGGIILLAGGAYMEKKRREIREAFQTEHGEPQQPSRH